MPQDVYEILSLGARYAFTLLGVLIVWRSFRWLRKDRRAKHRRIRQLPDAGMIGEMVVLSGSDELPEGAVMPVPREGCLGRLRSCDLVVPVSGVAPRHCDFTFRDGKGLLISPRHGCTVQVDDETLLPRSHPSRYPMHHGSRLTVGDASLRLRLFAGLETERHAAVMDDAPESPESVAAPNAPAQPWQDTAHVYHQVPAAWPAELPGVTPVQPWPANAAVPVWPVDAAGQPWPMDAQGQPVWPADAQGQPWPADVNGLPWPVDAQGQPWPVGENGQPVWPAAPDNAAPIPEPETFEPARARSRAGKWRRRPHA